MLSARRSRSRPPRSERGGFARDRPSGFPFASFLLALACLRGSSLASADPHLDSPGGHGARASLDRAADADPLATRDSYADLSASHEAHFRRAGRSSGGSLDAKIERLATPLEQTLTVEVKLVGFDGDGARGARLTERDLAPFLEALRSDVSEHALPTVDGPAADLGVATRFHFHVVRAPAKLNADVQTAIHESVASAESKFIERAYDADDEAPYGDDAYGGDDAYDDEANDANDANDDPLASGSSDSLALVPHELVDSLVALDHRRSSAPFTIYLLNPSPPPNGERYAYSYDAAAEGGGAGGAGGGGGGGGVARAGKFFPRGSPGCPGQAWFGDEHRAWIDLTADPPRADLVDDPSEDGGVYGGGSSSDDDDALFSSDGSVFSGDAFDAFGSLAGPRASLGAPPTPRITRANSARRRGEATPPVAPALASLIRRVAAGALAPPAAHAGAGDWDDTEVAIVRVADLPDRSNAEEEEEGGEAGGVGGGGGGVGDGSVGVGSVGVGSLRAVARVVESALRASATLPGRALTVTVTEASVGACPSCVAALHRAARVAPAFGTDARIGGREYVDAAELRYWLAAFRKRLGGEIGKDLGAKGTGEVLEKAEGVGREEGSSERTRGSDSRGLFEGSDSSLSGGPTERRRTRRVVPVFVFDLARSDPLLLDRRFISRAFPDMALLVRTRAAELVDPRAACGGFPQTFAQASLARPLLAAALETAFAAAPTSRVWSEAKRAAEVDPLFAVGNDPWGTLSASFPGGGNDVFGAKKKKSAPLLLPFVASHAAKRHATHAALAAQTKSALRFLRAMRGVDGGAKALGAEARDAFEGRWASFEYKRLRATRAAAMRDFERAAAFVRSATIDLVAAGDLVADAFEVRARNSAEGSDGWAGARGGTREGGSGSDPEPAGLAPSLECFEEAPFDWGAASVAGLGGVGLVWAARRFASRWDGGASAAGRF